jgi:hypothetical protein
MSDNLNDPEVPFKNQKKISGRELIKILALNNNDKYENILLKK